MRVLLHAELDRPGIRAMLGHLAVIGVDARLVHSGRGDLLELSERDRAWLAAHSAWRGDARRQLRLTDLWDGPEPAPGVLPVATGRRAVLAMAESPEAAARLLRMWTLTGAGFRDATLVIAPAGADADPANGLMELVDDPEAIPDAIVLEHPPPDLRAAVADATVVVGRGPVADAATELGRVVVPPGPGLAARLGRVLVSTEAPPQAFSVAALVAKRLGVPLRRPPSRRARAAQRPLLRIQGDIACASSLAQLNRELARAVLERGGADVELHDPRLLHDPGDRDVAELLRACPPSDRRPDLLVLNGQPPSFVRPSALRVASYLHWEFGPPPREWVHSAQLTADEVWVDSDGVRGDFVAAGMPEERVLTVPLGVDATRFGPHVEPADLGDAAPGVRLLFVGGLVHRKGVDLLLDAYRLAFTADDDVTLVLKRPGPGGPYPRNDLDNRAETMAADTRGPRVALIEGAVSERSMATLYRACHCLVHPYRGEAFGMTMIEAMASGLPVIAPDRGAARAFMDEHTALLVPARRRVLPMAVDAEGRALLGAPVVHEVAVADLAAAMRRVVDDLAAAQAVGRRARRHVVEHRTWAAAAEMVVSRMPVAARRD